MKSMPRTLATCTSVALLAALGGCTSLPVTTDANPNQSVAGCRSYVFAAEHMASAPSGNAYGNPLNGERLRAAIAANLAARGIARATDPAGADCVVGYAIGTRVVADEFAGSFGWGFGWHRGYAYGAYGWPPPVRNEGRIAVDFFDAHSRTALWHASVEQNVTNLTGPNAELRINEAAGAIFSKFPVAAAPASPAPAGKTT